MQLWIINGANLNLLGKREPNIYGSQSFEDYFLSLRQRYQARHIDLNYFQSNHEGEILDKLHEVGFQADGIILNAGAFTHTSIAIADAIKGIQTPVVEVHISNTFAREGFRNHSYLSAVCRGVIVGFGLESYRLAIDFFIENNQMNA